LTILDVALHAFGEMHVVPFVYAVDFPVLWDLHIWMGEAENPDGRVQGETVDAIAGGVHQHGGGSVYDVAGRDLCIARL
jgi:hypothetical protein